MLTIRPSTQRDFLYARALRMATDEAGKQLYNASLAKEDSPIDTLDTFLAQYRTKRFKKGSVILHQDMVPSTAYVVKKGIVKSYNLTAHGEEKPINLNVPGQVFPLGWVFGKLRSSQYYYEAFSDCELYCVPVDEYMAYVRRHPAALYRVLEWTVASVLRHQMRINALEQSKADGKVLHTLHFLSLSFGQDIRRDVVELAVPFTQQDIANFTGLSRETTSTQLKKLTTQGVLRRRGQTYIIRTDKLNELLDDEYGHRLVR